jgi:uncharacterized UBP type Zn finger protein
MCRHLDEAKFAEPASRVCNECIKSKDTWVHLRMCLECGQVGCCDNSKNKHATKHFQVTKHPIVRSAEPEESWLWCYIDSEFRD